MEKKRKQYDASWDLISGILGRYPILLHYKDKELCPCDDNGFRLINDCSPLDTLLKVSNSEITYVCIGGSTTFGWFVDSRYTYPSQLNTYLHENVLNFGMPGLDMKNCLEVMLQVFAKRVQNLTLLFLFGINEKMGFVQMNDLQVEEFKVTHSLYSRLEGSLHKKSFMARARTDRKSSTPSEYRYSKFLKGQIAETNNYISLIKKLCDALNVETMFLLQPHGLRFLEDSNSKFRERYLADLYAGLVVNKNVIDISEQCGLVEDDFIDWQHPSINGYKKIANTIYKML